MDKQTYERLAEIVFRGDYPGYRPEVLELPNGDGKVDTQKRYAHVASKYLLDFAWRDANAAAVLARAHIEAHRLALAVADELAVPLRFSPLKQHGALRILEYPVGATSNLHTDFDLFTLMIYRDQPECFVAHESRFRSANAYSNFSTEEHELGSRQERLDAARKLNAQLHIGELGELIGLGPATPHEVIASDKPQHACVYFAIPDHAAVLPSGQTVGEWLNERMSRSRVAMPDYANGERP